jgi:hypothetical protein
MDTKNGKAKSISRKGAKAQRKRRFLNRINKINRMAEMDELRKDMGEGTRFTRGN